MQAYRAQTASTAAVLTRKHDTTTKHEADLLASTTSPYVLSRLAGAGLPCMPSSLIFGMCHEPVGYNL